MQQLPPMKIAQGEPFGYDATVTGQDWTGYTGTATFKARPKAKWRLLDGNVIEEPIIVVEALGNAAGLVQIGLSAAETAAFPALPRLGYFHRAVCEISMSNGADVQKYQARVSVAAEI